MTSAKAYLENQLNFATVAVQYNMDKFGVETAMNKMGIDTRDDEGAVSTEMAVVTAAFVAIAVAGGLIFIGKMRSNANNIPDNVSPPG